MATFFSPALLLNLQAAGGHSRRLHQRRTRTGIGRRKYKDWGGHLGRKSNHQVQNGYN